MRGGRAPWLLGSAISDFNVTVGGVPPDCITPPTRLHSLMPSKHALNVSLTAHLISFVDSQVASGRFGTASEVVRAALRLLEQDQAASTSGRHQGQDDPADRSRQY